jgi:hypothetical protein
MEHNRVIRDEFSKQASSFGDKGLTLSSQEILGWIVENLPLQKNYRVLDVAAGTGHLSRAIAPHVEVDFQRWVQMTGTDLETIEYIRNQLLEDVQDGTKTGMRPFMKDGALKFLQIWSIVIGTKTSKTSRI